MVDKEEAGSGGVDGGNVFQGADVVWIYAGSFEHVDKFGTKGEICSLDWKEGNVNGDMLC